MKTLYKGENLPNNDGLLFGYYNNSTNALFTPADDGTSRYCGDLVHF